MNSQVETCGGDDPLETGGGGQNGPNEWEIAVDERSMISTSNIKGGLSKQKLTQYFIVW